MTKIKILIGVMMVGLMLGGCGGTKISDQTKIEENVITKVGIIQTKWGDEYILSTSDGLVNVTSTKINLDDYLKKNIKVTGMFSGSTLYVDDVEMVTN